MPERILVADDDREIVRTVRAYLEESGYEVTSAHDGKTALDSFRNEKPDLVVLDIMMPEMNGLDVAKALRRESEVPIIMLTARVDEADRLIGLELGADDYITKPFSPREVVARVRAVLRRTHGQAPVSSVLRSGAIALDTDAYEVKLDGAPVELTRTEFSLLKAFMENTGRVMTRLQLIDTALGYSYEGFERTVDAHVKNLRQKVERDPGNPRYIVTVYGVGYKFMELSDGP
ncbi:MAG: response regulator transcription factor [Chloroflexi bacterium]|nr:response regulator transcription factor [Chloroflexota bacterium]MCI0791616.1 response regulator transcription factor [Chloroflexota bacterium]MCI0813408.1 response regulator transcription factor [Chloroflexota bacterium]MCI0823094.1 response regulator transcription factor [Chloroflexota bacterium]